MILAKTKEKQLIINLSASFATFLVGMGISFFLMPYIVKHLGAAAYGFVGLSTNIIDYTTLLTIALNSMAGRFVTICYTQGKIDEANKYFSSVFYSNIILAFFILLSLGISVAYLEYLFEIPSELIVDVKILFSFLIMNSIIGLVTNIYAIATFVKNRLELSSFRQIISKIIQAVTLFVLFGWLQPHLWYLGIAGLLVVLYTAYTNYRYTLLLTPELVVSKTYFDFTKVKELLSSGVWNTFNKLGILLGQGLDLVIANLFIGATAMGVFSISRQIPFIIIGLCATISNVFAPTLTQLYAKNDILEFQREANKAIRILAFIVTIPLSFMYVFGKELFSIWLPNQDSSLLYILSLLCGAELSLSLPLEVLWNIFTVTNKLKVSSIFMFLNHLLTFVVVLAGMLIVEDMTLKMIVLASTRTVLGIIRSLTFLPLYGAKCIGLSSKSFFVSIMKSILALVLSCIILYSLTFHLCINSWIMLFFAGIITLFITCAINSLVLINKQIIVLLKNRLLRMFI